MILFLYHTFILTNGYCGSPPPPVVHTQADLSPSGEYSTTVNAMLCCGHQRVPAEFTLMLVKQFCLLSCSAVSNLLTAAQQPAKYLGDGALLHLLHLYTAAMATTGLTVFLLLWDC